MVLGKNELKRLMEQYGLQPSKSLGQNFVIDPNTIHKIIREAKIENGEQILEIGPGLGSLTAELSLNADVTAIELDQYLIPPLKEVIAQYGNAKNVEIIHGNAMEISWEEFFTERLGNWKMIANLPYNIATPLLIELLENAPQITEMHIMVQWEVAERFAASHGNKSYGIPSVKSQYWADVKILGKVSPNVFMPVPKVDSALLKIRRKTILPKINYTNFDLLVKTAFRHRRKMLRKTLNMLVTASNYALAEVNPQARPEELSIGDWINLTKTLELSNQHDKRT